MTAMMDEDVSNLFTTPAAPTPLPLGGQVAVDWHSPIDPASDALQGLASGTRSAILDSVTAEHVVIFVSLLTATPQHADTLRHALRPYDWFCGTAKRDTQLRRIRTLREAAVFAEYPVATSNAGYWLGDWAGVLASADRAEKFARGAWARAARLKKLAAKMAIKQP